MSHGDSQRGSVMVIVVTMLAALLAGAGIAIYLQISDTRSTSLVRATRSALYCAEAGLAASRPIIGSQYGAWQQLLDADASNDPSWYPIVGDLDDPPDGINDYEVRIRDNDDELPPLPNDPTRDNDLRIFVVSRCISVPDAPREVLELVTYRSGGSVYRNQSGQGSGNTGNVN